MAHDLSSLITVVDGILHSTDQEDDRILDDHKKPLLEPLSEKAISLKNILQKPVITVLDRIFHCTVQEDRIPDVHQKLRLKSLLEKATSLRNLLEESSVMQQHHSRGNKERIEALQSKIRDAAHKAEDIIEAQAAARQVSVSPPGHSLRKVMVELDVLNYELVKIIKDVQSHEEETTDVIINPPLSVAADPTTSKPDTSMVGFDNDALHLKHRLTSQRRAREIIPIVGMGGIGKTTLARNLHNDPLIVSHFDDRAWVTVSQEYNMRAVLFSLLGCISGNISNDMLKQDDSDLGRTLYQRLCGRRYLIVLDDVWSEKVWDEIRRYFPDENYSSRILITSRELDVAKYPDSSSEEHRMRLLSHAQGWDLLRQKVFDDKEGERCPSFLEQAGRKIARDCGGLPLAINVIGGLLSVDKYSKDLWEQIAKDVSSVLSRRDEDFSKILSLSYDNLPLHLKPCFLYMAGFPEDFEVRGSKLVKLWVAEGFLWRSSGRKEDVAEEYLKALVDRNLLSVTGTKKSNGRAKSYGMHDLLRDLCVRKADDEKFIRIVKNWEAFNAFRRASAHLIYGDVDDMPYLVKDWRLSRSLLWLNPQRRRIGDISPILRNMRLVRILDVYSILLNEFPTEILKLVNLRLLAVTCNGRVPSGLWRLRNLQTLIIGLTECYVRLTSEAWEISGLRHIMVMHGDIWIDFKITRVHKNLQTIYDVRLHDLLGSNLINSMPNVRKLGICYKRFHNDDVVVDLSHLHKLEKLKLSSFSNIDVLSSIKLPYCLKKVVLDYCEIDSVIVNVLGALQYLEVFKVTSCGFPSKEHDDRELELNEGAEFRSLLYLELNDLRVVRWRADYSHFPILRHLVIRKCVELEEIPTSIAEISTLEVIDVDNRNPSLVDSAKEILDIQRGYGNESLKIMGQSHQFY